MTKVRVEALYFIQGTVKDIFQALGGDQLHATVARIK